MYRSLLQYRSKTTKIVPERSRSKKGHLMIYIESNILKHKVPVMDNKHIKFEGAAVKSFGCHAGFSMKTYILETNQETPIL